jgi:hypothetical protein
MNKRYKVVSSCQILFMMIFGVMLRDALGADVSIDINTDSAIEVAGQRVSVHPDLFGINFPYHITDDQRSKLIPLLKGKVRFLRWPEGAMTSTYSYVHPCSQNPYGDPRRGGGDTGSVGDGVSAEALTYIYTGVSNDCDGDGIPDEKGKYFTDIYEFIEFCKKIDAEPMIGIPLQIGFWGEPVGSSCPVPEGTQEKPWNPQYPWQYAADRKWCWDSPTTVSNPDGTTSKQFKTVIWRGYNDDGPAKEAEYLLRKLKEKNLQVKYFYIDNELGHLSEKENFYSRFGRIISDAEHNKAYVDIYKAINGGYSSDGFKYGTEFIVLDNSINKGFNYWWSLSNEYDSSEVDGYGWSNYYGKWGTCDKDATICPNDADSCPDADRVPDPHPLDGCNYYGSDFENLPFSDLSKNVRRLAEKAKSDFSLNGYSKAFSIEYEWNLSHLWTNNYVGAITSIQGGIWNAWNQMDQIKGAVDLSALWPLASNPFDSTKSVSAYIDVDPVSDDEQAIIDGIFPATSQPRGPVVSFKSNPKDMTPTGHLLQMLSENFGQAGDVVLETKNSGQIYSLAVSNESKKSLKIVILNKASSASSTPSVALQVKGNTLANYTSYKAYQFTENTDGSDQIKKVDISMDGNANSITLPTVPPMSMTVVLLESPIISFDSVASTDGPNTDQKQWTFTLPGDVSVDSLNISTNGTLVKRNYSVYLKANGIGELGREVVKRKDDPTSSTSRDFIVERTGGIANEITIIWNSVPDHDPPSSISLSVNGKQIQKLIPNLSQAVSDVSEMVTGNLELDASNTVDSDWNTIWQSYSLAWSSLQFDLSGSSTLSSTSLTEKRRLTEINHLLMRWYSGENYATTYDIQVSDVIDRLPAWNEFHTVKRVANSSKGDAYIDFNEPIRTRFLRIVFKKAPTGTGATNFSLREVSAWGKRLDSPYELEPIIPSPLVSVSDYNGNSAYPAISVLDSNPSTIWKSASSSDSYLQFMLSPSTSLELKEIKYLFIGWHQGDQSYSTNYEIQVSNVFDRTPGDSDFYTVKQVANNNDKNAYISFEEKPIITRFLRIVFKGGTPVSVNKVSAWGGALGVITPLTSHGIIDEGSGSTEKDSNNELLYPVRYATDDDKTTQWRSASTAWSYLRFDLADLAGPDTTKEVKYLMIDWGDTHATNYDIQISDVTTANPGPTWDQFYTIKRVENSAHKDSYIEFEKPVKTRYMRIVFKNAYGVNDSASHFSVSELKAWGHSP